MTETVAKGGARARATVGVEIADRNRILRHRDSMFVGFAVNRAGLHAPAREPGGERLGVMAAALGVT